MWFKLFYRFVHLSTLGCLIVEIQDHRDQTAGDSTSERVVLWPNDETLYAEICLTASTNEKWTDLDSLTYEANHLVSLVVVIIEGHCGGVLTYLGIINSSRKSPSYSSTQTL